MSRRGAAIALVTLALAGGCGGSDDSGDDGMSTTAPTQTVSNQPHLLAPADARVVDQVNDQVGAYCRKVGEGLGGGEGPTPSDFETVTAALDQLAAVAARDPEGATPDGSSARLALGDLAENLEGSNCDPRLVAQIDEALASLPSE